jgi:ATP adenylyltransferase
LSECIFCNLPDERVIDENEVALAIRDGFAVTEFHTLIIPKRHISSYFDLSQLEKAGCDELLSSAKSKIIEADDSVSGFNIGINVGEDAGQTVFHCHIHLIPRRKGDVEDPRGGVRGVIAGKQKY